MVAEWSVAVLIALGSAFSTLAALGILRMPDFYMRLQVNTKSATVGVACLALAGAITFGDLAITSRAILIVMFLFLTAPVAAHVIGLAGYRAGVPMWERTAFDEFREHTESPDSMTSIEMEGPVNRESPPA